MSKAVTKAPTTKLPAHLQEPPAWLAKLSEAAEGLVQPGWTASAEDCFQFGIACGQSASIRFAQGGYWIQRAKELSGGGRRWVEAKASECGVKKSSVYGAMQLFNLLNDVGDEEAIRRIATLDYSTVNGPLRKLGAEGLRRLAQGEEVAGLTWDEACSASRRDLESHMRQLQGEREEVLKAERRAEAAAQRADELQAEVKSLREQEMHLSDLPTSVRYARVEGAAFGLMADEGLIRLRELLNNVYQGVDLHAEPRERQMEMELGVKAIATVCRGLIGQASQVLRHIESKTPEFLTEEELDYPVLGDAEARAVHERFRKMIAMAWFSLDTAAADLPGKKERRRAR
jgi:hypothetical protein